MKCLKISFDFPAFLGWRSQAAALTCLRTCNLKKWTRRNNTTALIRCVPTQPTWHRRPGPQSPVPITKSLGPLSGWGGDMCTSQSCCWCVVTVTFPLSSAIHEFPDDLFTNNERKSGAVLLHIVAVRGLFIYFFFSSQRDAPASDRLILQSTTHNYLFPALDAWKVRWCHASQGYKSVAVGLSGSSDGTWSH